MTPCEELGYKVGDMFRVIESRHPSRNGSIVTLHKDDGSRAPYFMSEDGDQWVFRVDSDTNDIIEKIEENRDAMTERVTLKPGDYVSTEGMDEEAYHAVARAFIEAGADEGEYEEDDPMPSCWDLVGWDEIGEELAFWDKAKSYGERCRHLTIDQVLTATNAGNQAQDTLTTILESAAEHDAKAKHHSAEHDRLMQQARDMLPDGWRMVKAEDMPDGPSLTIVDGQDMSDPANWREGDVIEAVESGVDYTCGKQYTITGFDGEGCPTFVDDAGDDDSRYARYFRFHHRPNT